MTTRPARLFRGLVAAFFAVFVAALSHVAGGGTAPGGVGLALALAFSSVVCVALAGRSLSIIRLSVSVAFSQLVLHALFTVGAGSGDGATVSMTGMTGMTHGAHEALVVTVPAVVAADAGTGSGGLGLGGALGAALAAQLCSGMWIAHAIAAVLTVLALRHGESAFWGLLGTARLRLRRLVRVLAVEPVPVLRLRQRGALREPDHLRDRGVFLGRLRHRGPPSCVRFAI